MNSDPIVTVAQVRLLRVRQGELAVFRGVPYARSQRLEPPRPVPAWRRTEPIG